VAVWAFHPASSTAGQASSGTRQKRPFVGLEVASVKMRTIDFG
jgi:hypothetical protein